MRQSQQCSRLRQGFLLAAELLLEPFDLLLILGAEAFKLPLLFQGVHKFFVRILGCLPPPFHLLRLQTPLPAVGAEFGGVQASGLQHHRELIGGAPALRSLSDAGTTSPCNRQAFLQF